MEITNTEKISLIPSALSALVLFVCLVFLIPGAGNVLLSSIIALVAYPIILLFTCFGISVSRKVSFENKYLHSGLIIIFGAALGLIGYAIANIVLYMQGTILAFVMSGAVAGLVVSIGASANKSSNLTGEKDSPSS